MCFKKKPKPKNSLYPKKEYKFPVIKGDIKPLLLFLVFIVVFIIIIIALIKMGIDSRSWYNLPTIA